MRLSQAIKALTLVLLLNTIPLIELTESAIAAPRNTTRTIKPRRRLNFRVGVRPSRSRVGGYSRSATCDSDKTLQALVPPAQSQEEEKEAKNNAPLDKTIVANPTFFVYLPTELATGAAEFVLRTEAQTKEKMKPTIYQKNFQLTGQSGMIGISLPQSVSLQMDQEYVWEVTVNCNTDPKAKKLTVIGWVKRVQPPATATGDKLYTLAEEGVWQDTMSTLALRRYEQPNDRTAAEDWASLMEDVKMSQFKDTAIVQIVKD